MPEEKKTVMFDSSDSASVKTITGWVSEDGRFFGQDENLARFCGATHRSCKNNPDHPVHEVRGYCDQCNSEKRAKVFSEMPTKDWDGGPLVDFNGDHYFFDASSLHDYLMDDDVSLQDLRLCICNAEHALRDRPSRSVQR